jgi:cystathionine beta-synthase
MKVNQKKYQTLLHTIGHTPLVKLQRLCPNPNIHILVKLEFLNPGASIKDRIVSHIVDDAEKRGLLKPGGTIIENTSGNTGAAVAMIAAIRGYKAILTMPDKVSKEKQNTLKAFGAQIIVTPTTAHPDSPEHYVNVAKKLAQETPNSFRINQYDNLLNPEAHYLTTGPEIWDQTGGDVDYFIASASTGGTVTGIGRYLKEKNPKVQVIMPDPIGSIFYEFSRTGKIPAEGNCNYYLEGIGEDHMPKAIDFSCIDEVIQVTDKDAFRVAKDLAQKEGILAGGSSGANVWAAIELAKKIEGPATIVTVLPDSGIKYLSKMYDPEWLKEHIS